MGLLKKVKDKTEEAAKKTGQAAEKVGKKALNWERKESKRLKKQQRK